jgi:hypothetical protein
LKKKAGIKVYHSKTNCFELFAHIRTTWMNLRSLVCTAFLVNLHCWDLSKSLKQHKTNCEKAEQDKSAVAKHTWTYDRRIKWDEATILAIDSSKT